MLHETTGPSHRLAASLKALYYHISADARPFSLQRKYESIDSAKLAGAGGDVTMIMMLCQSGTGRVQRIGNLRLLHRRQRGHALDRRDNLGVRTSSCNEPLIRLRSAASAAMTSVVGKRTAS